MFFDIAKRKAENEKSTRQRTRVYVSETIRKPHHICTIKQALLCNLGT